MSYRTATESAPFKIAAARRILYREGCDSGIAGQVSARTPDGMLITTFGYFDEARPGDVSPFDLDGRRSGGSGEVSPAVQFHAAIYRSRPDVGSVVHTHSRYATVVASTSRPIGMYCTEAVIFSGEQALFADDGSAPSVDGPRVVEALGADKHVLLVKNHGAIVVAASVEDAAVEALTLEKAARCHVESLSVGASEMHPAEVAQARRDYDRYYRPACWQANLRRLERSDPDLFATAATGEALTTARDTPEAHLSGTRGGR